MPTREEIERILREDLDRTHLAHERAKDALRVILADTPSGLPHPDGSIRISRATAADSNTRQAYWQATREFTDFILNGTVPERLKDHEAGSQPNEFLDRGPKEAEAPKRPKKKSIIWYHSEPRD